LEAFEAFEVFEVAFEEPFEGKRVLDKLVAEMCNQEEKQASFLQLFVWVYGGRMELSRSPSNNE
jgi:hypothetical protein